MSNQRYIILAFVAAAIIAWSAIRSASAEILATAGVPDPQIFDLVAGSSLAALSAGVVTFFVLLRNTKAVTFVDEVVVELRKMFWPKREETINSTTVVLVATVSLAAAIAFYDFFWAKISGAVLFS